MDICRAFFLDKKFLLYNLVVRNIKLKYRNSFLGFFWSVLVPAANALVYIFAFKYIMKVAIPNYALFIVWGILPWSFYSLTITAGLESIVSNQALIGKVPIPPHLFIFSETANAFINLLLGLPILILLSVCLSLEIHFSILIVIPLLILFFLQTYGAALIVGTLYVYFRDLKHLINVFIQILFYATPVLYSTGMVPDRFQWVLYLNPLAFFFEGIHESVMNGRILAGDKMIVFSCWSVLIFAVGCIVMAKTEDRIAERL